MTIDLDYGRVTEALGKTAGSKEVAALVGHLPAPARETHPDGAEYWVWTGVELLFEEARLTSVFAQTATCRVSGLDRVRGHETRAEVEDAWGKAQTSGERWVRYERPDHSVHFEFGAESRLSRITMMFTPPRVADAIFDPMVIRKRYESLFGAPIQVLRDAPWRQFGIEVDVYEHRTLWVVATIGASAPTRFALRTRYEFLTFVEPSTSDREMAEVADMLRIPARMHLDEGVVVAARHTIRWGRPLFSTGGLEYIALLEPPDLGHEKEELGLLWAYPLTRSEYAVVRRGDFSRLLSYVADRSTHAIRTDRPSFA